MSEFTIEYGDILKAYQSKVSEILNQLITAEAKLIASVNYINKLQEQINVYWKQRAHIQCLFSKSLHREKKTLRNLNWKTQNIKKP